MRGPGKSDLARQGAVRSRNLDLDICYSRCNIPPIVLPERIRELRKALGFSQEKFAQFLGVTWTTVHRWEAGHTGPTGMPMRILALLESRLGDPAFRAALQDPRAQDPMFVLYNLLGQIYATDTRRKDVRGGTMK